ncbi:MAG TPA: flavodoxin family protein [bacterium]|nr:flavodoxin family protein [bacterium]HPP29847.1 flavodoxin family protein [bacterium]
MKISIIYFSLSGRTKFLAQSLAESLRAEGFSVAINPLKSPSTGAFLKNCIDALTKKKVKLEYTPDIKHSEIIFLGSPVWAFDITPAMRTFLENVDLTNKKVFLYITYGSGKGKDRAMSNFRHLVELKGGKVIGTADIKGRSVKDEVERFKEGVKQCLRQFQLIKHP